MCERELKRFVAVFSACSSCRCFLRMRALLDSPVRGSVRRARLRADGGTERRKKFSAMTVPPPDFFSSKRTNLEAFRPFPTTVQRKWKLSTVLVPLKKRGFVCTTTEGVEATPHFWRDPAGTGRGGRERRGGSLRGEKRGGGEVSAQQISAGE